MGEEKGINTIKDLSDSDKERIDLENYKAFSDRKKGTISEFFTHMLAYGGFTFESGIMRIWGDPSLFIPMKAFINLHKNVIDELGDEGNEIFYWIGKMAGRNASLMLVKKFGFNPKDLPDFVNGATQDGLGYVEITKYIPYKDGSTVGEITGTNARFSLNYIDSFGKQKSPIDYYLLGILAGGSEPLFNKFFKGREEKCVAKGDQNCFYIINSIKNHESLKTFNDISLNEELILNNTKKLVLSRVGSFKFFGKKDIKFGDGAFVLMGMEGINMMTHVKIVLDRILLLRLKDKMKTISSNQAKLYIQELEKFKPDFINNLKSNFKGLNDIFSQFCYGNFDIKIVSKNKILISNSNNPYALDYLKIFGKSKECIDILITNLFLELFQKIYPDKKITVKEISCLAKGDRSCLFEINIL